MSKVRDFFVRGILTITGIAVVFCTMYNILK
jgi:hypothetical protein